MKRSHVHVSVEDIEQSSRFYSPLFAAEPAVSKPTTRKLARAARRKRKV